MQHLQQKQKQSIQILQKATTVTDIRKTMKNNIVGFHRQITIVKKTFDWNLL